MNLDPDTPWRVIAILEQPGLEDFAALVALSGLDPAQDFRRANLRNVAFGTAGLSGYDFSGADLTGADLSRARGRAGVKSDPTTIWPEGWGPPPAGFLEEATRMVLRGEAPPGSWRPFITEMRFYRPRYLLVTDPHVALVGGIEGLRDLTDEQP